MSLTQALFRHKQIRLFVLTKLESGNKQVKPATWTSQAPATHHGWCIAGVRFGARQDI